MSYSISRRAVLRGLGVALSLPLLNVMRPVLGADSQFKHWSRSQVEPVPRAIFCYVPNGVNIEQWQPNQTGHDYQLSPSLKVLEELRSEFSVISGLGHPNSEGGHSGADTWLTGADLKAVPGKDYANTISADQILAEHFSKQTRYASLQLSDQSGTGSAGHSHTLSFDRSGTPLPAENSPQRLFQRLFVPESAEDKQATLRRFHEKRSILDSVLNEANRLSNRVGKEDREKLDQYLSSVRQTELRIERMESWIDRPKPQIDRKDLQLASQPGDAHDRPMWIDVMLEISYLAIVTDSTRVISFEWSREAGGFGGGGENHHELSHHGGDAGMLEKLAHIDRFHLSRLKRFMEFLASTREGDGTVLDSSVLMFGSGMNSGKGGEHSPKNLPLLLAGGKRLGMRHNHHLGFDPESHPPLSNVLLSIIQKMGVAESSFSDSTGTLTGLV
ncbi:MAG: DUF1552 domain-containing protein [Pirellula sp.]|nr:DUF1552 domain-containing protein [Pirellula sp.]